MTLRRRLLALRLVPLSASAVDVTTDLGKLGEVTTWLIIRTPVAAMEVDPFQRMGGEAKYAAMGDQKLFPQGDKPLAIPVVADAALKLRLKKQIPISISNFSCP